MNKFITLFSFFLIFTSCGGNSGPETNPNNTPGNQNNGDALSFSAWISPTGSEIDFNDSTKDYEVFISINKNCVENYRTCPQIERFLITEVSRTLQFQDLNINNEAYIMVIDSDADKNYFGRISADIKQNNRYPARNSHQVTVLNDKIFLVGGYEGGKYYKDVWSSIDGVNWNLVTDDGGFSARYDHRLITVGDKMFLSGGEYFNEGLADLLSSTDGLTWTTLYENAPYETRQGHQMISFNGKIFLLGGLSTYGFEDAIGYQNDVWSWSPDVSGDTWTQIVPYDVSYADNLVTGFETVVFQDNLYFIGGGSPWGKTNKVWKSSDGEDWTEVITNVSKFEARYDHQVVNFNNTLYLIGGGYYNLSNSDRAFFQTSRKKANS